jgi:hypothetical protein
MTWELHHGKRGDQMVYPVRALLSWDVNERRLHILVGEVGTAEALEQFAERSVGILRRTFPECHHEVVFWGEADESGLKLMAEEASRAVVPGERVPYALYRLALP